MNWKTVVAKFKPLCPDLSDGTLKLANIWSRVFEKLTVAQLVDE
jgi:hypothetical protein